MKKRLFVEVVIFVILSLTPLWWFKGDQMLLGHDSGFRLIPWDHLKNFFYSWNPLINYGRDWSLYKAFLVTQFPETIFAVMTGSVLWGQRLALVGWFFTIGLGSWLGIYLVFPDHGYRFLRLWSAVFAMYNFFILQGWFIAERAKFSLFAAMPIAIALLYRMLVGERSILKHALLFGVLYFFFNGGGSPPLYGATAVSLVGVFIWFSFVLIRKRGRNAVKRIFFTGLGITVAFFVLNAYWIVPEIGLSARTYTQSFGDNGGIDGLIAWEQEISKNASVVNLLRLQGIPDWYDSPKHPFSGTFLTNPLLIILSMLPAILAFAGGLCIWLKGGKQFRVYGIFLMAMLLVGLILASGSHPPFGFAFVWAMRHVPGFSIFRSSFYKFGPLVWLPIIMLSGYALNYLLGRIKRSSVRLVLAICLIAGLIGYHYPFFTADIFSFYPPYTTRLSVPNYVREMGGFINANLGVSDRILALPALDSGYYNLPLDTSSWGFFSQDILPRSIIHRPVVANDKGAPPVIHGLYEAVQKNEKVSFERLAGLMGITHVLWRDDAVYKNKYGDARDIATQKQNVGLWDYPLVVSNGKWQLYKIPDSDPVEVYAANRALTISGGDIDHATILTQLLPKGDTLIIDELLPAAKSVIQGSLIGNIYQARCLYCDPLARERVLHGITISDLVNPPDSVLYKRTAHIQSDAFEKASVPSTRIDALLIRADTALASAKWYQAHSQKSQKDAALNTYGENMEDIIYNFSLLTDRQRNEYAVRLLAFLDAQKRYTEESGIDDTSRSMIKNLVEDYRKIVTTDLWMTENDYEFRFDATLETGGEYELIATAQGSRIMVDGKPLDRKIVSLSAGYHRFLVENRKIGPRVPELFIKNGSGGSSERVQLSFEKNHPSRYTIRSDSDTPYFLFLNEQFDQRWKVRLNGKPLPEYLHVRANGYANAWYIDGSETDNIIIYYQPHDMFLIGIAISIGGLIMTGIGILWLRKRS